MRRNRAGRAAVAGEEVHEQRRRLRRRARPPTHLGAVVEPPVADDVPQRADRAGLRRRTPPNTSRSTRDSTTAPAHIVHGSRVTTSVQPVEPPLAAARRPPRAGRPPRRARSGRRRPRGGCGRGRRPPRRRRAPPPRSGRRRWPARAPRLVEGRAHRAASHGDVADVAHGRRLSADELVEQPPKPSLRGDVGEHLVGVEVVVVEQRAHVHGGRPRSATMPRSPAGTWSSSSSGSGQVEVLDDRAARSATRSAAVTSESSSRTSAPATRTSTKKSSSTDDQAERPAVTGVAAQLHRDSASRSREHVVGRAPRPARRPPRGRRRGRSRRPRRLASVSCDIVASQSSPRARPAR